MSNLRWVQVRAVLAFLIVLLAVLVWNPTFTIAGIWDHYHRGYWSYRHAVSILVLGAAAIGCIESVRRRW